MNIFSWNINKKYVVNPSEIAKEIQLGKAVLLDVRTKEELDDEGYAENATHFNITRMENGELPNISKEIKVYIYCRSGGRAERVKNILLDNGFANVINIGGLSDWIKCGGKVINNL
ncbi:rhodanese-like domain-containing protein [Candidatus Wolfebacteria bacterium]|nr:rhodanese-like domain-containing protein [Candidatus Wolfebacteria bacterium]